MMPGHDYVFCNTICRFILLLTTIEKDFSNESTDRISNAYVAVPIFVESIFLMMITKKFKSHVITSTEK